MARRAQSQLKADLEGVLTSLGDFADAAADLVLLLQQPVVLSLQLRLHTTERDHTAVSLTLLVHRAGSL